MYILIYYLFCTRFQTKHVINIAMSSIPSFVFVSQIHTIVMLIKENTHLTWIVYHTQYSISTVIIPEMILALRQEIVLYEYL